MGGRRFHGEPNASLWRQRLRGLGVTVQKPLVRGFGNVSEADNGDLGYLAEITSQHSRN